MPLLFKKEGQQGWLVAIRKNAMKVAIKEASAENHYLKDCRCCVSMQEAKMLVKGIIPVVLSKTSMKVSAPTYGPRLSIPV